MHDVRFAQVMERVARQLLGEPNRSLSSKTELRFGRNGSLSIDLEKGTFFDFEANEGGGVLDLIAREQGIFSSWECVKWLREHGFDADLPQSLDNGREKEPAPSGAAPEHKIVATYGYTDEIGELLFQVVRLEPKTFRQRRPNGMGGWTWSVKGTRIVPYRLPEVLDAIAAEETIFIVEGEKDVERLRAAGLGATCNPMGAGKWRDEFAQYFQGARVVIIPDNDNAGRAHAEMVGSSLLPVAGYVLMLELPGLPPKGDVSDWLDAGGSADGLRQLVQTQARPFTPSGAHNSHFQRKQRSSDSPHTMERKRPGPAQAEVQLSELLQAVYVFTGRFIAYPSDAAHVAHVLWVAHAHLMDAWESTPRLAFLSPEPSSGKTRALEISELLVPNGVEAINVTPAYLFRKVGDEENGLPTILYDEIDTIFGPKAKENEEIRGLLNAGHRRGAVTGRCVVHGKRVEPEEIPAYCAVALAGLGWLPDTILARSVIVRMRRRAPGEGITPFRRRVHGAEGHELQVRLAVWAARVVDAMAAARPEMPPGIEDRDADVWEPLLAIADAAAGEWPKRARDAARILVLAAKEVELSLGIRLLADLKTVFDADMSTALPTEIILSHLIALPESPWGDLKGKPITDRSLASRLRQYGVKSKVIRIGDRTPRGYTRGDLYDAWIRYLPALSRVEAQQPQQAQHTAENSGFLQQSVRNVADGERNNPSGPKGNDSVKSTFAADVSDVADVRANRGVEQRCDHCGGRAGLMNPWSWPGRPGGIWLHPQCEEAWYKQETSLRSEPAMDDVVGS